MKSRKGMQVLKLVKISVSVEMKHAGQILRLLKFSSRAVALVSVPEEVSLFSSFTQKEHLFSGLHKVTLVASVWPPFYCCKM